GGLGIATYGIVKSLQDKAKIRLIIPSAGEASELDRVTIIGLNALTSKEIDIEKLNFSLSFPHTEIVEVPIQFSPYHYQNEILERNQQISQLTSSSIENGLESIHSIFTDKNAYGFNLLHKVNLFARVGEELSADGDFDVIHAHDWVTFPAAIKIKKRTGEPLILHVHALETDRSGESTRNEIYWLEKDSLEQADRIIAVSEYTKDQIGNHYQIDRAKITVVHNGIDPANFERVSHKLRDKLVVFLGRITHQKGPNFLLETAEKVARVYPKVKFVVAGVGDQFSHLLETSAYKKIGNKFLFTGFLSKAKVNELLSMADVYFMPSVSEPFGLTALEAAQHKVPSVISSQSGAAEVMKESLQADFWDTDKQANYIHALLRYKVLNQELSEAANKQLDNLSWANAAQKIMEVYQQIHFAHRQN
ncbi:MAG: glycosyltransferase family 4 protein, partial [Cyclobacteriaceae bacterium]|nr:glycosyltransferase family 4 protein [Cyclobacteriaceae bacterium]